MTEIDLFGLKDAHVAITGASGGIGIATVRLFDQLGARISAQGRTQTGVLSSVTKTARELNIIQADATKEEEVEKFYQIARGRYGPVDVLIGTVF
jgi:NADP-dependent 3-hydroxy acid dehydrogenase YdfG